MAMRRDRVTRLAAIILTSICAFTAPSSASALDQTVGTTSGAVTGRITDESGGALARTAVTLSGEALMGDRVTISGHDGHYRFLALPPGEYTITFERAGFQRGSSGTVRVSAGFTATVDAVLQVPGIAETVTVEKWSGVIDRHSTAIAVNFGAAQLDSLPGSRSVFAILSATPGIQVQRFEVGGNTGEAAGPYSAYGTRGLNRPMVEGISVSNLFPMGFALDFGAFEEVSVGLGAHGAEWPLPGVQMQFVAKSGGDSYHGTLYGDLEHRIWQSYNIDAGQQQRVRDAGAASLSREANRLWQAYDINADLGGFIARERAWWYGSIRKHDVQLRQLNFPVKPSRTRLTNYTAKTTYSISPLQRLVGFVQTGRNHKPNHLDPFGAASGMAFNAANAIHLSEDATSKQRSSGLVWKGEWNAALSENVFVETRVGQFFVRLASAPNGAAPRSEDIDTLLVTGGGRNTEALLRRNQFYSTLSYFRNRWLGRHDFKIGAELLETIDEDRVYASFPGNVLHVLRSGVPTDVYIFQSPSASLNGLLSLGAHAGDTWQIDDRLTLDLGVRFDRHRVFLPEQAHPSGGAGGGPISFPAVDDVLTWSRVAPRVGGTFDLLGDRTTVLKASYGRYWLIPADLGPNVNANAGEWSRGYVWRDLNADGRWQSGEEGPQRSTRGGVLLESIDPALRTPFIDEATGSVERELPAGLGLRSSLVWRRDGRRYARQNVSRPFEAFSVPIIIRDTGPDGVNGTADDGSTLTGHILHVTPGQPAPPITNIVRNVENSSSRFLTWELAVHRRQRGRWSLSAGFAHTWQAEHANSYAGQGIRQNVFVLTPNDLVNTDEGRHAFRTWTAIASASVEAPWKLTVSPLLRHQSGQPFGRTISAVLNIGTIRMLAEPIGTRRMDNVTLLDVRVERTILRSGSRRAALFLDVFNLLNANPEQNINWASGPGFLQPITVVAPRIARIGLKASF